MNASPRPEATTQSRRPSRATGMILVRQSMTLRHRSGFTLVEILVVVVIIGVLAGIGIPAAMRAITTAGVAAAKMEINSLDQAAQKYQQKYGDYPPDGSNKAVLERHMRKLFPRMSSPDNTLLTKLTQLKGEFSPVAMDRAEALVFFLGGFSEDIAHPLTGPGGPLEFKNYKGDGDTTNLANYQYNATRDNAFFPFDTTRLDITRGTSGYVSSDGDLLPIFRVDDRETPIVYFDSRTYGKVGEDEDGNPVYNGYLAGGEFGGLRPYKTIVGAEPPTSGTDAAILDAYKFHQPRSFQIISPGDDGVFGAIVSTDPDDPAEQPVYFVTETGQAVTPNADATSLVELHEIGSTTIQGFNDLDWSSDVQVSGHLDNVTNFSDSTLGNDLES